MHYFDALHKPYRAKVTIFARLESLFRLYTQTK